jgi:hypothetical protein
MVRGSRPINRRRYVDMARSARVRAVLDFLSDRMAADRARSEGAREVTRQAPAAKRRVSSRRGAKRQARRD